MTRLPGDAAREFGVQRAVLFYDAPVGCDAPSALGFDFRGGVRGNPGKDSRRDRAGEVGPVFFGQGGAQFVNGDAPAFRDLPHQGVHFARRRNDHDARAPALAHVAGDRADFRQPVVVG